MILVPSLEPFECNAHLRSLSPQYPSKGRIFPIICHRGSTLSVTWTLDEGQWSMPHRGHFTCGNDSWYPFLLILSSHLCLY
jgi:hypothetical protein